RHSDTAADRGRHGRPGHRTPLAHDLGRRLRAGDRLLCHLRGLPGRARTGLFMNILDFVVLIGSVVGIAAYGVWRTRGRRVLSHYLRGNQTTGWLVIGISVMATQASAITFISTPGQGYQDGLGFVQNYFGAPLALIVISAVFLPMYRRLNVYTAYEFL